MTTTITKTDSLIAAANDLLHVCKRVAALNPNCREIGAGMLATMIAEATAAIAKADGNEEIADRHESKPKSTRTKLQRKH